MPKSEISKPDTWVSKFCQSQGEWNRVYKTNWDLYFRPYEEFSKNLPDTEFSRKLDEYVSQQKDLGVKFINNVLAPRCSCEVE